MRKYERHAIEYAMARNMADSFFEPSKISTKLLEGGCDPTGITCMHEAQFSPHVGQRLAGTDAEPWRCSARATVCCRRRRRREAGAASPDVGQCESDRRGVVSKWPV